MGGRLPFLPSPHLWSLPPSWRSGRRLSSFRRNTGWTLPPWASTRGGWWQWSLSSPLRRSSQSRVFGSRGKLVLGYSETELVTRGSGYQFIHAADMMYCADNHLKSQLLPRCHTLNSAAAATPLNLPRFFPPLSSVIKTGNSGFTFFRLLTKTGCWLWVQASARVVFKNGRPDFIIARQKALT